MARCELDDVSKPRHKYRKGLCKRCGVSQEAMLRQLARRRVNRRQARLARLARAGKAQV